MFHLTWCFTHIYTISTIILCTYLFRSADAKCKVKVRDEQSEKLLSWKELIKTKEAATATAADKQDGTSTSTTTVKKEVEDLVAVKSEANALWTTLGKIATLLSTNKEARAQNKSTRLASLHIYRTNVTQRGEVGGLLMLKGMRWGKESK